MWDWDCGSVGRISVGDDEWNGLRRFDRESREGSAQWDRSVLSHDIIPNIQTAHIIYCGS
jgi:hypothetical protein